VARESRWKLGLFVVVAASALVATLLWLGALRGRGPSFPAVFFFDESVQGLDSGTPVKFRGVDVGRISEITIAPDGRHVQVKAAIEAQNLRRLGLPANDEALHVVRDDLRVKIETTGLAGTRFLELDFVDPRRHPAPTLPFQTPSGYIPSTPSAIRSLEERAVETLDSLPVLVRDVSAVSSRANAVLAEFQPLARRLSAEDGPLLATIESLSRVSRSLEQAIREANTRETMLSLRGAADSVTTTTRDLGRLEDLLERNLEALERTLEAVRGAAELIERDPSAVLRGRTGGEPPRGPRR
jgi:ABC-type transporter Mla subunit MlaD